MTLSGDAYKALAAAYPACFVRQPDDAPPLSLPPNTAIIVDATAGLEPSSSECGAMTVRARSEFVADNARVASAADVAALQPATWHAYAHARTRAARSYLHSTANVALLVACVDIKTPAAKYPEHAERYGATPLAATDGGAADDEETAAAAAQKAPVEVASDAEVDEALRQERLPRDWKKYRGNKRFLHAVMALVIDAILESQRCGGENGAASSVRVVIVGDPRIEPLSARHIPIMYTVSASASAAPSAVPASPGAAPPAGTTATVTVTVTRTRLEYPEFCLDYYEADFSVVHFATTLAAQGMHTLVRAIDGDTLLALLMSTPRRTRPAAASGSGQNEQAAAAPRLCYMVREVAGTCTLINTSALYAQLSADASPLLGRTQFARCNVEFFVVLSMLLGNDYALKFMPKVGYVRLARALSENADEMAPLVSATPANVLRSDARCKHEIRVSRRLLHRLVDILYGDNKRGISAAHRPEAHRVNVAHAVLEFTLNYFANASNPWVPDIDIFARGPTGLSLHGYELRDATQPPSRHNVRHATRVESLDV